MKVRNAQVLKAHVFKKVLSLMILLAVSSPAYSAIPDVETPTSVPEFFANAGTVVNLSVSATDPDGTELSYLWKQLEGEAATITNGNAANASFLAPFVDQQETLKFQVTVTDAQNESASKDISLAIGPVDKPVFSLSPDAEVLEGTTVSLFGGGFFLGEQLTDITWKQLKGPAVPLSSSTEPSVSFVAPEVAGSDGNSEVKLEFQINVVETVNNIRFEDTVVITVKDNGIAGLDGFNSAKTVDGKVFGVRATTGDLVALAAVDVARLTNHTSRPRVTPIGLAELTLKTNAGGSAVVDIKLVDPLPGDDFTLYTNLDASGWHELASNQFSINSAGDLMSVNLQDGSLDLNENPGLVKVRVGPGQVSPRTVAESTVGGALGIWSLIAIFLLISTRGFSRFKRSFRGK